MQEDGLDIEKMETKAKEFTLAGDYRRIKATADDISWEEVKYRDPYADLQASDRDALAGRTSIPCLLLFVCVYLSLLLVSILSLCVSLFPLCLSCLCLSLSLSLPFVPILSLSVCSSSLCVYPAFVRVCCERAMRSGILTTNYYHY